MDLYTLNKNGHTEMTDTVLKELVNRANAAGYMFGYSTAVAAINAKGFYSYNFSALVDGKPTQINIIVNKTTLGK